MEKKFEVLWYQDSKMREDSLTEVFLTRKQALSFYEKHKNDKDKFGWWITHRNSDWEVTEDILI